MKRTLLIMMAVVLTGALIVSCSAEISGQGDELVNVSIAGSSKGLSASGTGSETTVEGLYWYYTASKTSGGFFRTGETAVVTPVKTDNGSAASGLMDASLGQFSKGTWTFEFAGFAEALSGTNAGASDFDNVTKKPVYTATVSNQEVASAMSLSLNLEEGDGIVAAKLKVSGVYLEYEDTLGEYASNASAIKLFVYADSADNEPLNSVGFAASYSDNKFTFTDTTAGLDLDSGSYLLYFAVKSGDETIGEGSLLLTAKRGITYTVTGDVTSLDELYEVTVGEVIETSISAETTRTATANADLVIEAAASLISGKNTTVTFDSGNNLDGEYTLTTTVTNTEGDDTSFEVGDSTVSGAIASIDLSLYKGGEAVTSFGSGVTVATYIQKGLDAESITVVYGDGTTGAQPTNVSYNSATGLLTFTTTHFSSFNVVIRYEALNVTSNTYSTTLAEAISSAESGDTIKLLKDIAPGETLVVTKSLTLNASGHSVSANHSNDVIRSNGVGVVLDIVGGTWTGTYVFNAYRGSTITISSATALAQETCVFVEYGASAVVNSGSYTSLDNFVLGTNGSSGHGDNSLTVNGGIFNANIKTSGYSACGIYWCNSGNLTVNGGTFNVDGGVALLLRSGNLTAFSSSVECNLTNTNSLGAGKVGDSRVVVEPGYRIAVDYAAGYPGGTPTYADGIYDSSVDEFIGTAPSAND